MTRLSKLSFLLHHRSTIEIPIPRIFPFPAEYRGGGGADKTGSTHRSGVQDRAESIGKGMPSRLGGF